MGLGGVTTQAFAFRNGLEKPAKLRISRVTACTVLGIAAQGHGRMMRAGQRPGMTTEESAELKRLRRENAELKRANAILKSASAFFAAELDRPQR